MPRKLAPVRLMVTVAFAIGLVVASSVAAAADSGSGQHGHFDFRDLQTHPEVTCAYTTSQLTLTSIVVRPPRVWWPDTNAGNTHEHGNVGWRAIVQMATDGVNGPWSDLQSTRFQKAVAFEDHPLSDPADAAPFTKRTLAFHGPQSPLMFVRVVVEARWYNADGSVKGWQQHVVGFYHYTSPNGPGLFTNMCNNRGLAG